MPQEYKQHCRFTPPSVQQPDFEKSICSEDCMRRGMQAWLTNLHRGDLSWQSFVERVPSSCSFKSTHVTGKSHSFRCCRMSSH